MTNANVNNDNDTLGNENDNDNDNGGSNGNDDNNDGDGGNDSNDNNTQNGNNDNSNGSNDGGNGRRRGPNFFMINENHNCNNNLIKNQRSATVKNEEHHEETSENLKQWISIDSATTTSVGTNKEIFHSIQEAKNPTGIIGNGGELDLDSAAEINNVGGMPFNEDGMANLFSVNDLVERGFRVMMDSDQENCIFVEKDGVIRKFITSNGGLYFHDLWNQDLCFEKSQHDFSLKNNVFMQSQKENSKWQTKRQINKAKEAQNLSQMMMFLNASDFKNAIKMNCIHNCPVTIDDVNVAEDAFGEDILH